MIYVHVPFCRSFCTYCDFFSEICRKGRDLDTIRKYADGVCGEIVSRAAEISGTMQCNTLYFGGGTPSVLPLSVFEQILNCLEANIPDWTPPDEFTVEVNPEDISDKGEEYVRRLSALGVNRISMGVQSLDAGILKWMNRRHDPDGARKAFGILKQAGIGNVSVDTIFGVGGMDNRMLEATVREIIGWNPTHISAYQLSIEEGGTLDEMLQDGRYEELGEEACASQYKLICRLLSEAGYRHYEISNWALPGFEARHNSAYWKRLPYAGLGPGAHSLSCGCNSTKADVRSWNSRELSGWISEKEVLTAEEIREEELMLGLRTAEGWNGQRIPEDQWFVSDEIILDAATQSAS